MRSRKALVMKAKFATMIGGALLSAGALVFASGEEFQPLQRPLER